jgi:Methyltransferase domain
VKITRHQLPPPSPNLNASVERFQGSLLHLHYRTAFRYRFHTSVADIDSDLQGWMRFCNFERPHRGYRAKGRRPAQIFYANRRDLLKLKGWDPDEFIPQIARLQRRPRGLDSCSWRHGESIAAGGGSAMDKADCIVAAYLDAWRGTVLDVGCRSSELREALGSREVRYMGLDIQAPADIVADLDDGIPLEDGEATTVVALDVLEHTDQIHEALMELFRVASGTVIVSLPNCYDVQMRIAHLLGRPISGKYGLPLHPPGDRHRWFFSLDDARAFCRAKAWDGGWVVVDEGFTVGPRRARFHHLVARFPNLLATTYVARFGRR